MVSLTLLYGDTLLINFPQSHFLYKPFYCLWSPLFYFYVKYCFKPDYKLRRKHWFHFLPFAIFLVIYIVASFNSKEWIQQTIYAPGSFFLLSSKAIDALVSAQLLLYITLMLIELRKAEKASKHPEHILNTVAFGLNWMRFVIYFYTFSGTINFSVILLKMVDYPYIDIINTSTLLYSTFSSLQFSTKRYPTEIHLWKNAPSTRNLHDRQRNATLNERN
jgi:hypothetical protein